MKCTCPPFRSIRKRILENVVYFELLRRGYDVAVGKIGSQEIDFIATKDHEKIYFQATDDMTAELTRQQELAPLKMVRDNYRKNGLINDEEWISHK